MLLDYYKKNHRTRLKNFIPLNGNLASVIFPPFSDCTHAHVAMQWQHTCNAIVTEL